VGAGGIQDPLIDLVGDDHADVGHSEVAFFHGVFDQQLHFMDGEFIDFAALEFDVVFTGFDRLSGGGFFGSAGGDVQQAPAFAVGGHFGVLDASVGVLDGGEDHCAGAVAEEDATTAIFVIREPSNGFSADDENVFVGATLDKLRSDG